MTEAFTPVTVPVSALVVRRRPLRRAMRRPSFFVPATVVVLLVLIAVFPALFAGLFGHGDPRVCQLGESGVAPTSGHPFGYDLQGCDVYANVIYGTRASLSIGLLTTAVAMAIALVLGTIAGLRGGWVDAILSRVTDIFLGFPQILGSVVVLNSLGDRSVVSVSLVIALFAWPTMARIMRGSVKSIRQADFVLAGRTLGLSSWRLVTRYILPSSLSPLLVIATITVGGVIVAESTLTYLGIGLQAPAISWGLQLAAASNQFQNAPHLLVFPALFLAITVLSIISLGDTLRSALDPRRQQ